MVFGGLLEEMLLRESASVENVVKAMDNHSKVIINYHTKGEDKNTGTRVIEPITYGLTKAGNPVIRAYQPYGDTTSTAPGWKMFRLDRISYWEETDSKFYDVPSVPGQEANIDGDESMATVIKTYRSTMGNDATNAINIGPKTKEKVYARTSGDDIVQLGNRNVKNQEKGIKVDIDNNRKANSSFNMYTKNTQPDSGPRVPDQSYKPKPNEIPKDVDKDELERARAQVKYDTANVEDKLSDKYWSDYEHKLTDKEQSQADWDMKVMNREPWQNKDLSTSRRKYDRYNQWKKSTDSGFKNSRESGNRLLYNMENDDTE
jgi:hypothetical protein